MHWKVYINIKKDELLKQLPTVFKKSVKGNEFLKVGIKSIIIFLQARRIQSSNIL